MDAHKEQVAGKGISFGKGCIRYTKPERIDFNIVEDMLVATEAIRCADLLRINAKIETCS